MEKGQKMSKNKLYLALISLGLLAVLVISSGCERKVTNEINNVISGSSANYVGSTACQACHSDIYFDFRNSGHPYKLNDADSAQLPAGVYYPYSSVPLPSGLSWDDVSMVIGGFRWKARYINNSGQILTGPNRQYNFETDEFVAYSGDTLGVKDYDCGPCHTTGYRADGNHQNGLPGLIGTWAENGVQCEACHGPGALHVAAPFDIEMKIDYSSEQCGKCHIRGDVFDIPADGGYIKHHEQWNEIFTTKHATIDCVHCHDPHKGLHELNPNRDDAIRIDCEGCHLKETESFYNTAVDEHLIQLDGRPYECITCHMPYAVKSAVARTTYKADIRSHLFRINTDSTAEMFTADGKFANGYLTLGFVCLQCHVSEDVGWAARHADEIHVGGAKSPQIEDRVVKAH